MNDNALSLCANPTARTLKSIGAWTSSALGAAPSFAQPFHVGPVTVDPPVVLAPMADVTNGAFRRICKAIGGVGLVCTEQISTQALHHGSRRTRQMLDWTPDEQPLSVQLFGADPAIMAEAARIVVDLGAAIVDINMGCWVPKVCRQGAGAALLRDADTALRVVDAVVRAVAAPVTVKMRAGWSSQDLTSLPLALKLQDAGVQAFTLHARTAAQGFSGSADWSWIRAMKRALRVPVIGNGDIRSPEDALRMIRDTGCDGIMVGRAAIGNPWILRDIVQYVATGSYGPPPSPRERVEVAMRHVADLARVMGEERAVVHLRGQLSGIVRATPGAARFRECIVHARTVQELREVLNRWSEQAEQAL
ncbi:MAG: tRNA dihydrouridine synthase DusB [Chthonomonadales bacterium]